MFVSSALRFLLLVGFTSTALGNPIVSRAADHAVTVQTVYRSPVDYHLPKTLYGRSVELQDGTLLSTWENYSPDQVYFPIYRSTDKGSTWQPFSKVTDKVNNWGLRYQPFLYVLPQSIGQLPKGTILLAGNSAPSDLSRTKIDMYASRDGGRTWSFVSSIAHGGRAVPNNGETPVWEPFLMVYNNQLVCYYSDQRDKAYGQKLVHQVSSDAVSWGPVVNDVTGAKYGERPGMTTVVRLPNGKWMMTFEYGGGPNPANSGWFPVYYRISDSPLTFASATNQVLNAGGNVPTSSPYVTWSPSGGPSGTIIVNAASDGGVFLNTKLGDAKSWVHYKTPEPAAYSRQIVVMDDPDWLFLLSAGNLNKDNVVTASVVRLPNL
ncbi:hypothetical protein E4U41_006481 [Claviceps citrina]|nr:hypothetical protein E4U41_006481 [Claviceps citrina]